MEECNHRTKYLGLLFCKSKHKGAVFSDVVDKVGARLASWKAKDLSFAGRGVLVKVVAQTLPSYAMHFKLIFCLRKFAIGWMLKCVISGGDSMDQGGNICTLKHGLQFVLQKRLGDYDSEECMT